MLDRTAQDFDQLREDHQKAIDELRLLRRWIYGSRRERHVADAKQQHLFEMGELFAEPEPSAEQSSASSEVPASAEDAAQTAAAQEKAARRRKKRADRKLCLDASQCHAAAAVRGIYHHPNSAATCALDRRHAGDVLRAQRKTGADEEGGIVAAPRSLLAVPRTRRFALHGVRFHDQSRSRRTDIDAHRLVRFSAGRCLSWLRSGDSSKQRTHHRGRVLGSRAPLF